MLTLLRPSSALRFERLARSCPDGRDTATRSLFLSHRPHKSRAATPQVRLFAADPLSAVHSGDLRDELIGSTVRVEPTLPDRPGEIRQPVVAGHLEAAAQLAQRQRLDLPARPASPPSLPAAVAASLSDE